MMKKLLTFMGLFSGLFIYNGDNVCLASDTDIIKYENKNNTPSLHISEKYKKDEKSISRNNKDERTRRAMEDAYRRVNVRLGIKEKKVEEDL